MNSIYALIDLLLPFECFSYKFMKHALLALLLLTPMLALLGTMAVNKRMAFFSDALGHSALAGIGIGTLLGIGDPLAVLIVFGIVWALLISRINRAGGASADTNISVFSSIGVALGLVLLSRGGQFTKHASLLTGDILAVTPDDLFWLAVAFVVVFLSWLGLYNKLLLTAVNPALAQSRGLRPHLIEYAFVCLVSVAVMLSIRWVGVLLINALLILPAAAARNVARNAAQHALLSLLFSVTSGVLGLVGAYHLGSGAGAAIVLCAGVIYVASLLARKLMRISA